MAKILIVEDDNDINNLIKALLMQNGYSTVSAYSGTEALMCIKENKFDLIILDLMLPGLSGIEVLEKIKEDDNTRVIIVSSIDDVKSKVKLIKEGADDYMSKPFDNEELMARVEAVLRRDLTVQSDNKRILLFKDMTLNKDTLEVKVANKSINLTKNEFKILELLMSKPDLVHTKNSIFEFVWKEDYIGEDNVINVHISNIRKKIAAIDPDTDYIQTVWGIGFKMNI